MPFHQGHAVNACYALCFSGRYGLEQSQELEVLPTYAHGPVERCYHLTRAIEHKCYQNDMTLIVGYYFPADFSASPARIQEIDDAFMQHYLYPGKGARK